MALTINIKGKGTVEKVVEVNSATLTATPEESWLFKYFEIGDNEYSDNPYTFEYDGSDLVVYSVFYIPIENYLKGLVGFDVTNAALTSMLIYRNVDFNSDINDLTQKQLDLLYADLLMWASTNPSSYTGAKQSDGGWSQTEASKTLTATDKKRYEQMANDIYIKYNDSRKSSANIRVFSWNGFYR
ncbi:hypothetical protein [uncultured Dysgonomonas sp.]|uniref:Uncharacterized protein n=1 Tax=uncultured Dysgonomonas sp. TaxID=206096 RepID=A0A212IXK7_9BACT|nr:hypothetical protein [uncultured Dysgonomonas sp.]SBV91938.1 hypothetical protein KL86DYS1_10473 [uncultured Dysgonomonas sp.]